MVIFKSIFPNHEYAKGIYRTQGGITELENWKYKTKGFWNGEYIDAFLYTVFI